MRRIRRGALTIGALAMIVAATACTAVAKQSAGWWASAAITPSTVVSPGGTSGSGATGTSTGVARTNAQATKGIAYATSSPSETLDLYLPSSNGSKPVPVVVLIHGGGFSGGDSSMEATYAQDLVTQGFAAASINYRLSGEAKFPAGAQDVKAAVRWLRAHAGTYGLDPTRFAAWGQSAGGWMANMLGATGDQKTIFDDAALGNAKESSAVQAVVSWFGPTNFATLDTQAKAVTACDTQSPVHSTTSTPESQWLGAAVATSPKTAETDIATYLAKARTIPAWYLTHGDADCTVPGGQSLELKNALASHGIYATYVVLKGAHHIDPAFDREQLRPTITFLKDILNP